MNYNVTVSGTDYEGISKVELPITDSNEKATFYAEVNSDDIIAGRITEFVSDSNLSGVYPDGKPTNSFNRAYAFYGMIHLETVSLTGVISIPSSSFDGCTLLKNVNLPLADSLGGKAFNLCTSLEKLDFPSMKSILANAFNGCTSLDTLILRRTDVVCTLVNANAFTSTLIAGGTGYIYVPSALIDSYKTASNWSTYANQFRAIEDYPDICG